MGATVINKRPHLTARETVFRQRDIRCCLPPCGSGDRLPFRGFVTSAAPHDGVHRRVYPFTFSGIPTGYSDRHHGAADRPVGIVCVRSLVAWPPPPAGGGTSLVTGAWTRPAAWSPACCWCLRRPSGSQTSLPPGQERDRRQFPASFPMRRTPGSPTSPARAERLPVFSPPPTQMITRCRSPTLVPPSPCGFAAGAGEHRPGRRHWLPAASRGGRPPEPVPATAHVVGGVKGLDVQRRRGLASRLLTTAGYRGPRMRCSGPPAAPSAHGDDAHAYDRRQPGNGAWMRARARLARIAPIPVSISPAPHCVAMCTRCTPVCATPGDRYHAGAGMAPAKFPTITWIRAGRDEVMWRRRPEQGAHG